MGDDLGPEGQQTARMRIFTDCDNRGGLETAPPEGRARAERVRDNLGGAGAVIALASAKGGVGKSVVAVNIAAALALKGRKVAIVDSDLNAPSVIRMLAMKPSRGLPMVEGIEPIAGPHGLRVVSSEMIAGGEAPPISFLEADGGAPGPAESTQEIDYCDALARMLSTARFGALDVMIIDVAPGVGRLHQLAKIAPLTNVVLASHSSEQAVVATRHMIRLAAKFGAPVTGLIENMAGFNCDGCRSVRPLMPEGNLAGVATEFALPILARLPFDPRLAEASDRGVLFVHQFADTPLGKSLQRLALEVERMIMLGRPASSPSA
jgi:ATP-binding protein involved in chromosome partitioning